MHFGKHDNAFIFNNGSLLIRSRGLHCVKSVQIWNYFSSLFSCIWTECKKIRTRTNSVFGQFSRSTSDRSAGFLIQWFEVQKRGDSKANLRFYPFKVHQMSTRTSWGLSGRHKLSPCSSSLVLTQSNPTHKKGP